MYLNNKEKYIIETFMKKADDYEGETVILKWKDGCQVECVYDSYIEDESDFDMDEEGYEEFWSFAFKFNKTIIGTPPVVITEDDYFLVNYHNFPDEILSFDGKKIN